MKDSILSYIHRIQRVIAKHRLTVAQKAIFSTQPITMAPSELRFVSLVSHQDVASYLCALKSLYLSFGEGKVIVISDGSLTSEDQAKISYHLPLSNVISSASIDVGACPRGGCWERLIHILDLTKDNYVIQVDSDTLTIGSTPEILEAYKANKSFLLATDLGQEFKPVDDVARLVAGFTTGRDKIGCVAEMNLLALPESAQLLYARGSAGFAGFAKGSFDRSKLETFSQSMQASLGARWSEWGSEQVASNFMIANSSTSIVLPYKSYSCFEPGLETSTRVFLHFYGTFRFYAGFYRSKVIAFINRYNSHAGEAGGALSVPPIAAGPRPVEP